jgi:adenylyltransferase/sulfurtransferase
VGVRSDIVFEIGSGIFTGMDLVLGGLDNRAARLSVGRSCARLGIVYIDGAIEVVHGIVKVFTPPGPCSSFIF